MFTRIFDIEFRKDGSIHDDQQLSAILGGLADLTDLTIISHGWNNDMAEAKDLYERFFTSVEAVADAGIVQGLDQKRVGLVRVFWPSKKFADRELIPGGGAASASGDAEGEAVLLALLEELKNEPALLGQSGAADPETIRRVDRAKQLVKTLQDPSSQVEFVECLRAVAPAGASEADDGSEGFFERNPVELFDDLKEPVPLTAADLAGGGAATAVDGGAAGVFGDMFRGVLSAGRRIANLVTYFQMKSRAGAVGKGGLSKVLQAVRAKAKDLPIHLIGHSFGGRLITAAASTLPPNTPRVTLTLLQAAFSHNGLSANFDNKNTRGAFRSLIADKRASGPIIITHTKNDRAVGIAYPLASRISRDKSAHIGDQDDPYGGMGRNGAQHTSEVDPQSRRLLALGEPYEFVANKIYNLRADAFIKDHSDITGHQVAYAFLNVLAS